MNLADLLTEAFPGIWFVYEENCGPDQPTIMEFWEVDNTDSISWMKYVDGAIWIPFSLARHVESLKNADRLRQARDDGLMFKVAKVADPNFIEHMRVILNEWRKYEDTRRRSTIK